MGPGAGHRKVANLARVTHSERVFCHLQKCSFCVAARQRFERNFSSVRSHFRPRSGKFLSEGVSKSRCSARIIASENARRFWFSRETALCLSVVFVLFYWLRFCARLRELYTSHWHRAHRFSFSSRKILPRYCLWNVPLLILSFLLFLQNLHSYYYCRCLSPFNDDDNQPSLWDHLFHIFSFNDFVYKTFLFSKIYISFF